jgi:SAM-dependent methyltransferase
MALLDGLPIGDVSRSVCVDYGVGSWGFACVYERLQHCAEAIGIDISSVALAESERVSRTGTFPYGSRFRYLQSSGESLPLQNGTADIFFAGESIEHVENTDVFLDEVHRVLKPGGRFILTTPNWNAYLYRRSGQRFGIGPEHVALMDYDELLHCVEPRFAVEQALGFNHSVQPQLDAIVDSPDFAAEWAAMFEQKPRLATGVILLGRRRDDYQSLYRAGHRFAHDDPGIVWRGVWDDADLHCALRARRSLGDLNDEMRLEFDGTDLIVLLWAHDWSGRALISIDGDVTPFDLYSSRGGFVRFQPHGLDPGQHVLSIRPAEDANPASAGREIMVHAVISYNRISA